MAYTDQSYALRRYRTFKTISSFTAKVSQVSWNICILQDFPYMRSIFLSSNLRIPLESLATGVGFGDEWSEIHLAWKTIQNTFSRMLIPPVSSDGKTHTARKTIPCAFSRTLR